jgi:WD40 repeat protein
MRLLILFLAYFWLLGCRSGEQERVGSAGSAIPPPVREGPPFDILGPLLPQDGLDEQSSDFLSDSSYIVWDFETASIYRLVPHHTCAPGCIRAASWQSADTLKVETVSGFFSAALDGTVRPLSQTQTPFPVDSLLGSADGAWQAEYGETNGSMLVTRRPSTLRYILTQVAELRSYSVAWSPTSNKLAFIGDFCTTGELQKLFVFDAESGELAQLRGRSDERTLSLSWRPDGSAIAIGTRGEANQHISVAVVWLTGQTQTIVNTFHEGELIPLAWSTNGRFLLIQLAGDRGFCEGSGPKPPTEVLTP